MAGRADEADALGVVGARLRSAMPVVLRWLLRLGPTNPIAVRLVQGGSRRTRHLYIRSAYLGVLIVVLLYYLLVRSSGMAGLSYSEMSRAAASAFTVIAYMQIALICLLAPVFMAGAIAQEADPKTWDILLTTPLSATQIVLGNLFGRLFFILALLLSSLPLFALTQYFGGVPGSSIFLSYLIAACATLLVGTIAIALSVSRLVGKRAVFAFYVAVISYLAVTWAIDAIAGNGSVTWMTAINPFLALYSLLSPTSYPHPEPEALTGAAAWFLGRPALTWCLLSAGISVVLMAASAVTVRLGGLTQFTTARGGGIPWYRKMFGLGGRDADTRPARNVWNNSIAWREAAARNATLGRILARWSFIAVGGLFGLGVVLYYHGGNMPTETYRELIFYTVMGELAVIALVALNMAATAISKEREDGTLDLLLTTPITQGDYLYGKLRGLIAYLLPMVAVPLGTLLIAGFYVGLVNWGILGHPGGTELLTAEGAQAHYAVNVAYTPPGSVRMAAIPMPAVLPEAGLVATIVTIPFMAFCVMAGLMRSLGSKGSIGAVVATVALVAVVGGIVGLCAWKGGADVPILGPALAAMNPAVVAFATTQPEAALTETINQDNGLAAARLGMAIGSVVCAAGWLAVVYGIHANMVRSFDMTVRRLAGGR